MSPSRERANSRTHRDASLNRVPVAFGEVSRGAFVCVRVRSWRFRSLGPVSTRSTRTVAAGAVCGAWGGSGAATTAAPAMAWLGRAAGWAVWVSAWPATAPQATWTAGTGGGIDDTSAARGTTSSGSTSAAGTASGSFGSDSADGCGWVLWGVVGCGRGHYDGAGADGA